MAPNPVDLLLALHGEVLALEAGYDALVKRHAAQKATVERLYEAKEQALNSSDASDKDKLEKLEAYTKAMEQMAPMEKAMSDAKEAPEAKTKERDAVVANLKQLLSSTSSAGSSSTAHAATPKASFPNKKPSAKAPPPPLHPALAKSAWVKAEQWLNDQQVHANIQLHHVQLQRAVHEAQGLGKPTSSQDEEWLNSGKREGIYFFEVLDAFWAQRSEAQKATGSIDSLIKKLLPLPTRGSADQGGRHHILAKLLAPDLYPPRGRPPCKKGSKWKQYYNTARDHVTAMNKVLALWRKAFPDAQSDDESDEEKPKSKRAKTNHVMDGDDGEDEDEAESEEAEADDESDDEESDSYDSQLSSGEDEGPNPHKGEEKYIRQRGTREDIMNVTGTEGKDGYKNSKANPILGGDLKEYNKGHGKYPPLKPFKRP